MTDKDSVTAEMVNHCFHFYEYSGVFCWKNPTSNRVKAFDKAGRLGSDGYIRIGFCGLQIAAHHMVWLIHTGKWPEKGFDLDHINGDREDNRFENLRLATRAQNLANSVGHSDRKIPLPKGVNRNRHGNYSASVAGKHIGTFKTPEDASSACFGRSQEIYGNFARK